MQDIITTRTVFENTIKTMLKKPDITATEIKELACAYSELTKNDHIQDMYKVFRSGFGQTPALFSSQDTLKNNT